MSWMRLLAVGKSIIGIRNDRSPYKMTQDNLLPKFRLRKGAEEGAKAAGETAAAVNGGDLVAPAEAPASSGTPGRLAVEAMPAPAISGASALVGSAVVACASRPGGRWRSRLAGAAMSGPVQEELRLEAVKVMRNDLRDADLEVVPSRHVCPLGSLQRAVAIGSDAEPVGGWRSKLTSRLFGVGRT